MNTPILELRHVSCDYTIKKGHFKTVKHPALRDISFSLHKGETLGLIGHNGAGKSTLLRILAGILKPDGGEVYAPTELSISLLSLQLGFSQFLSGRNNAIMGLLLLGYRKSEALKLLPEVIDFSDLGNRIDDPLRTYSTGMKARLGFSVAIKAAPDIMLVDEALGVGDAAFHEKSARTMKERMLSGQTVVFVSHDAPTIRELCSRVIWMENGVVRMSGDTEEVMQAYETSLVAG